MKLKRLLLSLVLLTSIFLIGVNRPEINAAETIYFTIEDLETGITYKYTSGPTMTYNPGSSGGGFMLLDPSNNNEQFSDGSTITFTNELGKITISWTDTASNNRSTSLYSVIIDGDAAGINISGMPIMNRFQVTYGDHRQGISGQENYVTNVDDAKPLSFFQNYLKAWDNSDGDVTSGIYVITDNYTTNKSVLGVHNATFGVKDSNNNESTFTIKITVVDQTKPVIVGNNSIVQISYTKTYDVAAFKSTLTVTDNYDTIPNSSITIYDDSYTAYKTALGTHTITFGVKDSSGNEAIFTKQIEVIDDVAPTFSGQSSYTKNISGILTVNDIKANLTAADVKDGNRTAYITVKTDGFTGNGAKAGTYTITFEVKDTKGNTSTFDVSVTVRDDIPPVWYVADGTSIVLIEPMTLTRTQIIDLLTKTGQITIGSTSNITFFLDEYSGNEDQPGVYNLGFNFASASGETSVQTFTISVVNTTEEDPIVINPKENPFTAAWNWIKANPTYSTIIFTAVGLMLIIVIVAVIKNNSTPKRSKNKYRKRR